MAKTSSNFVCQQCGYQSPSFLGKCPNCGEWNSLVEQIQLQTPNSKPKIPNNIKPIKLSEIENKKIERISTGISELDLVLGGGIVPGMAVLLSGEPGIGKSTLLLQLVSSIQRPMLYIAGEESASQIKIRAQRLAVSPEQLEILETTDVDDIADLLDVGVDLRVDPKIKGGHTGPPLQLVIVDSIQTLTTEDLSGTAGSVGQVRESAARLIAKTKSLGIGLFLVGHVTKDGTIAGLKVLEHIVDTVLNFEGDKYSNLRLLRTSKNRFGPTDEVGLFEMTDSGLKIANLPNFPDSPNAGSCLTIAMEGTRPMVAEIQALVTDTPIPNPRRVGSGIDHNRLLTIIAILQKRLNLPLYKEDIYVRVSQGLTISEPAADLAVALAILSSYRNKALPKGTVAIGELDLLGNVRKVNSLDRRVKEAKKLGYKNILTCQNLSSIVGFQL